MPGERTMPDVRTSDELTMLTAMLDWYREGVVLKLEGLSDDEARTRRVASSTTIAGLVKHLAAVEDSWFTDRFVGTPTAWSEVDWDADPDWEFHSALDDSLADLADLYRSAVARSREAAAGHALDDVSARPDGRGRHFSLRWALVHLLEETARHLGHLDILRELTDNQMGE